MDSVPTLAAVTLAGADKNSNRCSSSYSGVRVVFSRSCRTPYACITVVALVELETTTITSFYSSGIATATIYNSTLLATGTELCFCY